MRHLLATALLTLALATPSLAGSLGEVTAATGIQGTLARQGTGSSKSALGSVKSGLAKSTKPRDYDGFGGGGGGGRSGARRAGKKAAPRSSGSSARGSWVTGAQTDRGNQSAAWLKGGSGWDAGGGGKSRGRPRS